MNSAMPALDEAVLARVVETTAHGGLSSPRWCKVVGMLRQNWAIILEASPSVLVFLDDLQGIVDARFAHDQHVAAQQVTANACERHRPGNFPEPPTGTWQLSHHSLGRIYAPGRSRRD